MTATVLGIGLLLLFALTANRCVGVYDEWYYCTLPQRLFLGQKMIRDDWTLSQFVFLLNAIPCRLFTAVTGNTDGLILFMRFRFLLLNSLFYVFVYTRLRRFRFRGVAAAAVFCAIIPQTITALYYFTASTMCVMAVLLLLCADEKEKKPPLLVLTGVILAIGVMSEPFLLFAFGFWFVLIVIKAFRTHRNAPFLDRFSFVVNCRVFFFVTVGAVIVFAVFMGYLFFSGSFKDISSALPYYFTGDEYNKDNLFNMEKLSSMLRFYNIVPIAGTAFCTTLASIYHFRKTENNKLRAALLFAALVFLSAAYIHAALQLKEKNSIEPFTWFVEYHGVPLMLVSPIPYFLSKQKNARLFAMTLASVLCSVCIDISSDVILASCERLTAAFCVLSLTGLLKEFKDASKPTAKRIDAKKSRPVKKSAAQTACAILLTPVLLWNIGFVYCEDFCKITEQLLQHEKSLPTQITRGPLKGLYTANRIADVYNRSLSDLDLLKEKCGRKPVFIMELAPYMYLYLDLPYASFSAWYVDELAREYEYWKLRPEWAPAYIYVPAFDAFFFMDYPEDYLDCKLGELKRFVETGTVIQGEAGYIIEVKNVKTG